MRKEFLISAIFAFSICLLDTLASRVMLACVEVLYCFHMMPKQNVFFVAIILFALICCSIPLTQNYFETGRVVAIKENYLILQNGFNKVIAYYQGEAHFDDTINVCQNIKEIVSSNNFEVATFASWAKGNNIIGSIDLYNYDVLKTSKSIRNILYLRNIQLENFWANELLFGNGLNFDSDFKYLIIQSGLHVSFLNEFLKKIYRLFFYKRKAILFSTITLIILASIFYFPFIFVRCILANIVSLLFENKREAIAIEIIGCCLLKPYYIKSISLLIPLGLKLLSCFSIFQNKISTKMYLALVQLRFNGSCDLLSLVCFGVFRSLAGTLYLFAFIVSILGLPIHFNQLVELFLSIKENFPILLLKGKPNLFLTFLILKIIHDYVETNHKKHLYVYCLLLIFNQFQSLFIPFYRITQMDVGQGDSALICFPFSQKGLLIDVGGNIYKDIAKSNIIPYLNSLGLKEVDVIISHEDYDHSGSLESLQNNFKVNTIYQEKQEMIVVNGLKIYNPLYDKQYENDNDNSLISYFSIGQFGFLYLGDVSSNVEKDLVESFTNLQVDVIKLSHHGSISATSENLLENYQPEFVIISAGKNNTYDHPHSEIVKRVKGFKIDICSTQISGALQYWIFNDLLFCINSNKQMSIYIK